MLDRSCDGGHVAIHQIRMFRTNCVICFIWPWKWDASVYRRRVCRMYCPYKSLHEQITNPGFETSDVVLSCVINFLLLLMKHTF
jgi:hypothetical protein